MGYIYNDTELTKRESEPTLRLSCIEFDYYESKRIIIYSLKTLISIVGLILMADSIYFQSTLLSCMLIIILYMFYNSIRNRFNILLYGLLVYLRYFGFCLLLLDLRLGFLFFLLYPFHMVIEFSGKKKYNIPPAVYILKHKDYFRFIYYLLLMLILLPMGVENSCLIIFIYYLLYRGAIVLRRIIKCRCFHE